MKNKLHAISAAVLLAMAAAAPAHAALERAGPVNRAPSVGGYPAWFQDQTGITLEFCDLSTQAEFDNGWCVLIPPDGPPNGLPEAFPGNYFDEHFYYDADNVLLDAANGFRARLVLALEAAFANSVADGDQMVFTRHRIDIRGLPFDGDYRVITPFSDVTYFDQKAGDRIFETLDIGTACPGTFECTLTGTIGPFLLPSATAGGKDLPPMPDLAAAPPGTDPFYDLMVSTGAGPTPSPGTGKKYLADPARVGAITGSTLPDFTAYNRDGSSGPRNHNTFRIEVRAPSANHNGAVIYVQDGETNFTVAGRVMEGLLPGRVSGGRAVYRAGADGKATDVDVFTTGTSTLQARLPGQAVLGKVKPALSFWPEPCAGAVTVDPVTKLVTVKPGPYTAPGGVATTLANDEGSTDYWGQVHLEMAAAPASHICIVDDSARNAAGQAQPAYMLKPLIDEVVVKTADYNGPQGGTLTVTAESSDPTAVLTLAGMGSTPTDGVYSGRGPGAELAGNTVSVKALKSPPSRVQVVSSKGGAGFHSVQTGLGMSVTAGQAAAANVTGTVAEDCSATASLGCTAGQGVQIDLLANTRFNGQPLRPQVAAGTATASVSLVQAARLGVASATNDGMLTYAPNANVNGTDSVTFTVKVNNGPASDPATATITVTSVNDAPVAANTTLRAVSGVANTLNLLTGATDPDGVADIKNAVITNWPVELGPQPVPVGGTIKFTPVATTGNFSIGYKVVDAAGLQSANTAAGAVTVVAGETITLTRVQWEAGKGRWRVDGTDTIQASQTI